MKETDNDPIALNAGPGVIPVNYIAVLISVLAAHGGIDMEKLLNLADLKADELANPKSLISMAQYTAFATGAMQATHDPALGLRYGLALNALSHGELGIAIMSADSFREAIEIGLQYFKTRKPIIQLTLAKQKSMLVLTIETLPTTPQVHRFVIDSVLVNIHGLRKFLLQHNITNTAVEFPFETPADIRPYIRIFGERIEFGKTAARYFIPLLELDRPLLLANPANKAIALQQCQLALQQMTLQSDITLRVKQVLLARLGTFPTLAEMADVLFMSERTLRRKLSVHNTTYQKCLDEVRCDLAERYLRTTALPLSEIAELLGFSDAGNFTKAFVKWTHVTPHVFRKGGAREGT
jgi:AraC-like DNA-binding protein